MKSAAEQTEPERAESGSCRDYGSSSANSGRRRWRDAAEQPEVTSPRVQGLGDSYSSQQNHREESINLQIVD